MPMKKWVLLAAIICIVIIIGLGFFIVNNSPCKPIETLTNLSKDAIQSILTGVITFLGLFFTMSFQHSQTIREKEEAICPNFVVEASNHASANMQYSDCKQSDFCSAGDVYKGNVRTQKIQIDNCKSTFAVNTILLTKDKNQSHSVGSITHETITLDCTLEAGSSYFYIQFDDAIGTKYSQKIDYEYQKSLNKYTFVSHKPTKVGVST